MHPYLERIESKMKEKDSILCFGMDPVVERMRIDKSKNLSDEIVRYFSAIVAEIAQKISAVKPNLGFYLQYGTEGLSALGRLIRYAQSIDLPVILDAKLGDIGKTSRAYAKFVFETLNADAVTLNPYLGHDSLEPFFSYRERGFYILALTSNAGARLFQHEPLVSGEPLFQYVTEIVCEWNLQQGSVGAVIGATQGQFQSCIDRICERGSQIPLLIPGVGAQGGSYKKIEDALEIRQYNRGLVRINASSSISYAHQRFPHLTVEEAAYSAVDETLNS